MSKANRIVIDIETYRTLNEDVLRRVREDAQNKEPAQNVKKEIKELWRTTEAINKRMAEAVEKTAVDPLIAEVLCICVRVDGEAKRATFMPLTPAEIANWLDTFARMMDDWAGPDTVWVGHNIAGFDLAVLTNTFRRYGVRPPEHFPKFIGKRFQGRVYDTMLRTPCSNGLNLVSLDDTFAAMGLGAAKRVQWRSMTMCGALVGEAYDAGDYNTILDYCDADVESEERLYEAMTFKGTWGTFDRHDIVAAEIAAIRETKQSDTAMRLAIYGLMESHGMIPA